MRGSAGKEIRWERSTMTMTTAMTVTSRPSLPRTRLLVVTRALLAAPQSIFHCEAFHQTRKKRGTALVRKPFIFVCPRQLVFAGSSPSCPSSPPRSHLMEIFGTSLRLSGKRMGGFFFWNFRRERALSGNWLGPWSQWNPGASLSLHDEMRRLSFEPTKQVPVSH